MFRSRRAREEAAVAHVHASSGDSIGAGVSAAAAAGESSASEGNANTNTNTISHHQHRHHRAGIYLRTVKPGDAANYPQPGDAVKIHYEAFLKDTGEKFDSSRDRRRPISFRVGEKQVVEGLEVAMLRMSKGQIAEVTVPHQLAYGAQGYPPIIPPRSDLVFVVEVIAIASS